MLTTYNVRIWKITVYRGARLTTYYVRWKVDGQAFSKPFRKSAQAESFRADLVAAARKGEAFYTTTGLPVAMKRVEENISWYTFACEYVDAKWPKAAATTHRTIAEALTALTCQMFVNERGIPDSVELRAALKRWAFNTSRRDDPDRPECVSEALQWASGHTRPVSALSDPTVLRKVLDGIAVCLDGTPRAPSVVSRWRKILNNAVEHAIERKILAVNPIPALKWKPPRTAHVVDRRRVANPTQIRALLGAVRTQSPRLVAFYGCLYFAALRPEEAAGLAKQHLSLPAKGWGELNLEKAKPTTRRLKLKRAFDADTRRLPVSAGDSRTQQDRPSPTFPQVRGAFVLVRSSRLALSCSDGQLREGWSQARRLAPTTICPDFQ